MLPGSVDPALAATMLSAGFGAEQPGRLDDQGAFMLRLVGAAATLRVLRALLTSGGMRRADAYF